MASPNSAPNPSADRVLVVNNPSAGSRRRGDSIHELVQCLTASGLTVEVLTDLDAMTRRTEELHARGQLRAVVAAGGDGTVTEVVNRTQPGVPVAVFPLGTANLLAGYLAIKRDPSAMADLLREGTIVRLDAGRANGRVFLLMVGCGFDADVVHRLHRTRRGGHISYWTWARPILQSIKRYHFPDLRVYCDSAPGEPTHSARWAFAVNLPVYAGRLLVAPDADGTDGMLNVCTFTNGSFWHGLRYLGHVALGRHHKLPDYKSVKVSRVRIESDETVPYQLDGDPGGVLPVEIEIVPGRLALWAPRARALALGLVRDTADHTGA